MPAYERNGFDPPAPVARVAFRDGTHATVCEDVPMLIDSGADVSLVPRHVIELLGTSIPGRKRYEIEGFDRTRSLVPVVEIEMTFLGRLFRGNFLVVDAEVGILGRNVLNALSLLLDGPRLAWSEMPAR
ncbi:MAG: retroviral-like aspartic protease [Planctomycetes bacterium]|nr:retroviral-like aspartic protease [Planctomycetota bacterium]